MIVGSVNRKPTISTLAYVLAIIVLAFLIVKEQDSLSNAIAKGAIAGIVVGTVYIIGRDDSTRFVASAISKAREEHKKEEA